MYFYICTHVLREWLGSVKEASADCKEFKEALLAAEAEG